ncbi:anaphase-promoting complex, subunit 10/DOC domain-containing protein [Chytridium lagenaria]|nr:anaphase-promoting complex, subunit 10/DOC domain-containing protein [Chytridium lagenaria]
MSDFSSESRESILGDLRDVSGLGVWSLSSFKTGHGLSNLRDDNLDTYWQSDGPQPHWISIQFPKKIALQVLSLYVDHRQDESYTPSKISVRAGTNILDLQELFVIELDEPSDGLIGNCETYSRLANFVAVPLKAPETQMLQIRYWNHQNGKDTHLRQIKLWRRIMQMDNFPPFNTIEFQMYSEIR